MLIVALIFVLAIALVALGLGLSRRSQRAPRPHDVVDGIDAPPASIIPARPPIELEDDAVLDVDEIEEILAPVRLRDRLGKSRAAFSRLRGRPSIDDETWDELEDTLLLADVGVSTTERVLGALRERVRAERVGDTDALMDALHEVLAGLLGEGDKDRALVSEPGEPNVWMFVGVNGVGKTTTIAKVAQRETEGGRRVLLAAADTFRAAAAEQLAHWAEVVGARVVRGQEGADPGSVVFDAMSAAASRETDLVLVDTAGRLHTKVNLMAELEKLRRIVERTPGALKEVLLVLDATTGQNGLTQAREFATSVDVTGVVLTKLDGTAKGGIVLAIEAELGIPVKLIGVGESAADLVPFDPEAFAKARCSTASFEPCSTRSPTVSTASSAS